MVGEQEGGYYFNGSRLNRYAYLAQFWVARMKGKQEWLSCWKHSAEFMGIGAENRPRKGCSRRPAGEKLWLLFRPWINRGGDERVQKFHSE
jgi:hypothetical protein